MSYSSRIAVSKNDNRRNTHRGKLYRTGRVIKLQFMRGSGGNSKSCDRKKNNSNAATTSSSSSNSSYIISSRGSIGITFICSSGSLYLLSHLSFRHYCSSSISKYHKYHLYLIGYHSTSRRTRYSSSSIARKRHYHSYCCDSTKSILSKHRGISWHIWSGVRSLWLGSGKSGFNSSRSSSKSS